jgi:hypothetical protein
MRAKNLLVMGFGFASLMAPSLFFGMQTTAGWDALVWVASVILAGGVLCFFLPRQAHAFLLLTLLGYLAWGVGWVEIVAVVFWLFSAWSLGARVLRWAYVDASLSEISTIEALVTGVAIWLAVWGCMLHFPVNYRLVFVALCLLPCFAQARQALELSNFWRSRWTAVHDGMRSIPMWAWILGLSVISWVLRWAFFPTVGYDDHAQHLRIWSELSMHQRYAFDVQSQIWSAAPFAVDLMHAGLSLMAGGDARSAMNLVLAVSLLLLMAVVLSQLKLSACLRWLLIVLMASTPMLGNLLLSLQTELFLAVLVMAGFHLVISSHGGWRSRPVLGVLACSALYVAVKLPGAVLGVTLLAAMVTRWWSQSEGPMQVGHQLSLRALWTLIPFGFVALHAYGMAWLLTGNPVFPLYNGVFLSPYFLPENFSDKRWIHGFGFSTYVRVFFNTSAFSEGGNYTAGWQYLLMLPVAIFLALRQGGSGILKIALIPLLGFGLVMFSATQYWRYMFPIMPIACIVLASLVGMNNRIFRSIGLAMAVFCIVLNLLAFVKVSWIMRSPSAAAHTASGKDKLTLEYAPAALLTEKVNQQGKGFRVLYPAAAPYGATLQGTPLYVIWYSPARWKHFSSLKEAHEIAHFLASEKVDFVITDMGDAGSSDSPEALLRQHLSEWGSVVDQAGTFVLYRLSDKPPNYQQVFDLKDSLMKRPSEVLLTLTDGAVVATKSPQVLAVVQTDGAKQVRYSVDFDCPSKDGFFIAQMNWNVGPPYYRLVACQDKKVSFSESVPVPAGARQVEIYVTVRDTASGLVQHLTVEFNRSTEK